MLYKYLAWIHVDASQNQKGKQTFCGNVLGCWIFHAFILYDCPIQNEDC